MRTLFFYYEAKKNFQGFNLKDCRCEEAIKDYVYSPPGYGVLSKSQGIPPVHCCSCHLSPCIALEHREYLIGTATKASVDHRMRNYEIRFLVEEKMMSVMAGYFNQTYEEGHLTPQCIVQAIQKEVPTTKPRDIGHQALNDGEESTLHGDDFSFLQEEDHGLLP